MCGLTQSVTLRCAMGATLSLWMVAGCGTSPSPPSPTASSVTPFQTPTGSYTISGVVTANGQPIANADVNGWVGTAAVSYSYWYAHGPVHTDGSGAYQLAGLPGGANVWVQLEAPGYVQQCAASAGISGNSTVNVALVSTANVTSSPAPSAAGLRSISGTVVQMTAGGSQPVGGAYVAAEAGTDQDFSPSELAAAYTYTDATGAFALCDLPTGGPVYLEADGPESASAQVSVAPGQTNDVLITLPASTSGTSSRGLRVRNHDFLSSGEAARLPLAVSGPHPGR